MRTEDFLAKMEMSENEFWSKLTQTGWLEAVPDAERARLRTAVANALGCFTKYPFHALAVADLPVRLERYKMGEKYSPSSVIAHLACASFGKFSPVNIHDGPGTDGSYRVSFQHGHREFEIEDLWEDDDYYPRKPPASPGDWQSLTVP